MDSTRRKSGMNSRTSTVGDSERSASSQIFRGPIIIFGVALLVRVAYITFAHSYRFSPVEDHFKFGYEMARIARALLTGYGYADPFSGHTGPTAWAPPAYPLLIAGVFRIFGIYSLTSAWVLLCLNSIFSALTALAIYEIAMRCYSRKVALWSAWLWALYPPAMQFDVRWIWETSLSMMLFAFLLVLALRMRYIGDAISPAKRNQYWRWIVLGILWAAIALANSTLLLFLPICVIWVLLGVSGGNAALRSIAVRGLLAFLLIFIAGTAPWVVRNWRVFHAFIPFRSNFGAELYAGNGPGSLGFRWGTLVPLAENDPEHMRYAQIGELAYVREKQKLAEAYIASHRRHFASLVAKRFYYFWAGVPHPSGKSETLEFLRQFVFSFASLAGILSWCSP